MTQSMASPLLPLALAAFVLSFFAGCAASAPMPSSSNTPIVAGHGVGTFQVGELLYATDFSDTEHWTLQIDADQDSQLKPRVVADNGMLDIYAPQAGVTGWLNRSFSGPIAITYRVRCPLETQGDPGIQARDIKVGNDITVGDAKVRELDVNADKLVKNNNQLNKSQWVTGTVGGVEVSDTKMGDQSKLGRHALDEKKD